MKPALLFILISTGLCAAQPKALFYMIDTDKRGFQERWNLVHDRGLQGFCSWVLGSEDPEIWSVLPAKK